MSYKNLCIKYINRTRHLKGKYLNICKNVGRFLNFEYLLVWIV